MASINVAGEQIGFVKESGLTHFMRAHFNGTLELSVDAVAKQRLPQLHPLTFTVSGI